MHLQSQDSIIVCSASLIQRLTDKLQITKLEKEEEVKASVFYKVNGLLYIASYDQCLRVVNREGENALEKKNMFRIPAMVIS